MDIEKISSFGQQLFEGVSHAHSVFSLLNIGSNKKSSTSGEDGAMQSSSDGEGKADEILFLAACQGAVEHLLGMEDKSSESGMYTEKSALARVQKLVNAIAELEDPIRRKEIILTIGWGQSKTEETIPKFNAKDKKIGEGKKVEYSNINGINAVLFLSNFDDSETIKRFIRSMPTSRDILSSRLEKLDAYAGSMDKLISKFLDGEETIDSYKNIPWWVDGIPFMKFFLKGNIPFMKFFLKGK